LLGIARADLPPLHPVAPPAARSHTHIASSIQLHTTLLTLSECHGRRRGTTGACSIDALTRVCCTVTCLTQSRLQRGT